MSRAAASPEHGLHGLRDVIPERQEAIAVPAHDQHAAVPQFARPEQTTDFVGHCNGTRFCRRIRRGDLPAQSTPSRGIVYMYDSADRVVGLIQNRVR
jgi:hypothetical protein